MAAALIYTILGWFLSIVIVEYPKTKLELLRPLYEFETDFSGPTSRGEFRPAIDDFMAGDRLTGLMLHLKVYKL